MLAFRELVERFSDAIEGPRELELPPRKFHDLFPEFFVFFFQFVIFLLMFSSFFSDQRLNLQEDTLLFVKFHLASPDPVSAAQPNSGAVQFRELAIVIHVIQKGLPCELFLATKVPTRNGAVRKKVVFELSPFELFVATQALNQEFVQKS